MIKRKYFINKLLYEKNDQISFFGRDSLVFKIINLEKKLLLDNICRYFKLKKIIKKIYLSLAAISIFRI